LLPVMQAMCRWGQAHIADTWAPPDWSFDATPDFFAPGPAGEENED
jgi:hypothetical protein